MFSLAPEIRNSRPYTILLLLLAVALWALQVIEYVNGTVDDVFITLRVVNNVVTGHGYVFNPGEYVEGYSNWSWVTMLAGISKLTGIASHSMQMLWCAKGLSIFFALLALISVFKLTNRLTSSSVASALSVLFVACTSPFGYWSSCGLETPLVLFLCTSLAVQFHDLERSPSLWRHVVAGLSMALLAITRPEAVAYGAILLALLVFRDRAITQRSVVIALSFAVPFLVFLAWRYSTYGMLLPNTFYAKVGGTSRFFFGIKYCLESVVACFAVFPLLVPFIKIRSLQDPAKVIALQAMLLVLAFAYFFALYAGADWMPAYRFIVPALGVGVSLGVVAAIQLWESARTLLASKTARLALPVCIVLAACAMSFEGRLRTKLQVGPTLLPFYADRSGHPLKDHEAVADWINEHRDSIRLFATGEAGLIAFRNPEMKLLDLNGLMDTSIARMKKQGIDPDVVFQRDPDCVILFMENRKIPGVTLPLSYSAIILADPRFQSRYELRETFDNLGIFTRKPRATNS
jgi:hypothetical protein